MNRPAALLALLAVFAGSALAADPEPSLEYALWARFAKGSSVTLREEVASTTKSMSEMTLTLAALTKDGAKLDVANYVNGDERYRTAESGRLVAFGKRDPRLHAIDETLDLNGRAVHCDWRSEVTHESPDGRTTLTRWFSRDVPGGLVREEMVTTGKSPSSLRRTAIAWRIVRWL